MKEKNNQENKEKGSENWSFLETCLRTTAVTTALFFAAAIPFKYAKEYADKIALRNHNSEMSRYYAFPDPTYEGGAPRDSLDLIESNSTSDFYGVFHGKADYLDSLSAVADTFIDPRSEPVGEAYKGPMTTGNAQITDINDFKNSYNANDSSYSAIPGSNTSAKQTLDSSEFMKLYKEHLDTIPRSSE